MTRGRLVGHVTLEAEARIRGAARVLCRLPNLESAP
jgi:hypothetical protein